MGIEMEYHPVTLVRGILYFVTPAVTSISLEGARGGFPPALVAKSAAVDHDILLHRLENPLFSVDLLFSVFILSSLITLNAQFFLISLSLCLSLSLTGFVCLSLSL